MRYDGVGGKGRWVGGLVDDLTKIMLNSTGNIIPDGLHNASGSASMLAVAWRYLPWFISPIFFHSSSSASNSMISLIALFTAPSSPPAMLIIC